MIIIVFTFSLFSIPAMIGLKLIEEKRSRKFLFFGLREGADKVSLRIINNIKNRFSVLKTKKGKLSEVFMGRLIVRGVLSIKRKINSRRAGFLHSLRISVNLKKKGSASFFLKNVSEYKTEYIKQKGNLY